MYMEPGELRTAVHNVTGQITRFSHVASQVIDQNADPIYRNGMMVYVAQMQKRELLLTQKLFTIVELFEHFLNIRIVLKFL